MKDKLVQMSLEGQDASQFANQVRSRNPLAIVKVIQEPVDVVVLMQGGASWGPTLAGRPVVLGVEEVLYDEGKLKAIRKARGEKVDEDETAAESEAGAAESEAGAAERRDRSMGRRTTSTATPADTRRGTGDGGVNRSGTGDGT